MEPTRPELTLEESTKQIMRSLPPVIRTYLSEGKYTAVAQGLMAKYKLRIDQSGILERELMLLLMGIENPSEFIKTLSEEVRLDDETVKNIVQDINAQVFIPLRKEEEEQSRAAQQPKPVAPQTTRPIVPTPPRPVTAPAPHIAPLPPKTAMPAALQKGSVSSGTLGDAVRAALAPKPADTTKLLEDHEEPHIEFKTPSAPPVSVPVPAMSTALPKTPPVMGVQSPIPAPQPVNTPHIVPPSPISLSEKPPLPKAPMPPVTAYTADPYREPIDEK